MSGVGCVPPHGGGGKRGEASSTDGNAANPRFGACRPASTGPTRARAPWTGSRSGPRHAGAAVRTIGASSPSRRTRWVRSTPPTPSVPRWPARCDCTALAESQVSDRVAKLFEQVELPADFARRHPAELSGGRPQRVSIARTSAAEPDFLLCDGITSALGPRRGHGRRRHGTPTVSAHRKGPGGRGDQPRTAPGGRLHGHRAPAGVGSPGPRLVRAKPRVCRMIRGTDPGLLRVRPASSAARRPEGRRTPGSGR
ncbi:ATP-binding cassette domain-containing protein [Streptomyces mirabilis]|uniref:ATP-binding cassette domain-containing protein n=1 Tax=Streptomyces mirabilis TaxID=68239 RepID=UPI00368EA7D0